MHDLPDFDNPLQDQSSHFDPGKRRPGLEPIPEFDRADSVTVQVEILRETYDEILKSLEENEWEHEEGLRTVLLTGLGYLDGKLRLDGINRTAVAEGEAAAARRVDTLVKDLAAYHSMYSVMKFKAFKLYKVNQVLEFNISGLRATERMWEGWADRMRREHADLQAECIRLRALMSEFKLDWDKEPHSGTHTIPLAEAEPLLPPAPPELPTPSADFTSDFPLGDEAPRLSFWARLKRFFSGEQ